MKLLKRILKFLLALVGILVFVILILLWIDSIKTSYLDKSEFASTNSFLIKNVNIVPMTSDTVLVNKTLYIKDGIIEQIEDDIEVEGVEIIDAQNKYLVPGLIDMHVHVWDKYELGLYLSNGVTGVRNLWGMPMHLRIKEAINNDEIIGPSFFTTGPKLTGPEFIGDDNLNLISPEQAREKVIEYKSRGYDFIKTYYGLDKDIFDAVIEESERSHMDIAAHPSHKVPFSYHLHPQIKSIEHAEEIVQQPLQFDLNSNKLKPIIDSIAGTEHARYSPTIVVFNNIYQMMLNDSILDSEPLNYINPLIRTADSKNQFQRWYNAKQSDPEVVERIKNQHDFHITIVSELHKAGVPIICSTDAGIGVTLPGFSIHKELAFYKDAGLSNYEVLKTATINAAETHKIMNDLGSIEVGKISNLILIDENPLDDISALKRPSTVFIKGVKLDRTTLDNFDERASNRKNYVASAMRYLENLIVEK